MSSCYERTAAKQSKRWQLFGKAEYVSASRAYDHVFGYMVAMDVSRRGHPHLVLVVTAETCQIRRQGRHIRASWSNRCAQRSTVIQWGNYTKSL